MHTLTQQQASASRKEYHGIRLFHMANNLKGRGFSQEFIAHKLGIPIETVVSLLGDAVTYRRRETHVRYALLRRAFGETTQQQMLFKLMEVPLAYVLPVTIIFDESWQNGEVAELDTALSDGLLTPDEHGFLRRAAWLRLRRKVERRPDRMAVFDFDGSALAPARFWVPLS